MVSDRQRIESAVVSLNFSEAPVPQARSYYSDQSRFPAGEHTAASRAELSSHSALLGGPVEVVGQYARAGNRSLGRAEQSA
jgi:hypothetical protein